MDAGGKLSAAEKKTIEFGLAVAILSSCPRTGPPAAATAEYQDCSKQRASKQLRLWQGACLGGVAEAGSRARPDPAATNYRRQEERGAAYAGVGSSHNQRRAAAAELRRVGGGQAGRFGVGSFVSPTAEPVRSPASDGGADLRALGAVALAGCQSESARAVQKEALDGLWHGDCSPDMVSLFAEEMLTQVVLRGQGGCGQVARHVLDLMVSITADVAAAASLASSGTTGATAKAAAAAAPANAAAAASTLPRRFDVGLAVSRALDLTLVQLARELRRGSGGGGTGTVSGSGSGSGSGRAAGTRGGRRQQPPPAEAVARAAGAGLFLDAYEAAVACLSRAFDCLLAEGDPEQERRASLPSSSSSSPPRNHGGPPRPGPPPRGAEGRGGKRSSDGPFGVRKRGQGQGQGPGASIRQTKTTATAAASERMVERGVLPRGWDAGARRTAWAQRKLEALAEATTTMSSFRMGQLRLQRIVARVYQWTS